MKAFIPQYLHKPNKIVFMDSDDFMIIVVILLLTMLIKNIAILLVGIPIFYYYRKIKEKYPRGYIKHLPHIWGFKQFKYFPSIFIREFKE